MRRIALWAAFLVPLGIYVASLDGAVAYWDTGEMQVVPWIFGIAHPTGFPAFTILAGIFAHLFALGPVSWRITLFCALAMSGAAWFVARAVLEMEGDAFVACASAWLFAFGSVTWTRGTRAEVHALAAFFALGAIAFAVRWRRRAEARALIACALFFGLGVATHPIVALLLPALLVAALAQFRALGSRTLLGAALAVLLGVAIYAYLPLRSAQVTANHSDPTLRLGEPPGNAFWDFDHPASLDGLKLMLSGSQFGAEGAFAELMQAQTYAMRAPPYLHMLIDELTPLGLLLALGGLFALVRADRWLAAALILAVGVPVTFAFGYTIEADIARYYLISFGVAALLAGYGAAIIARELAPLRGAATLLVFALAGALIVENRDTFSQARSQGARPVIATVREKTPKNAILIAPWIFATPLAYAAYVEHSLDRRTVQAAWLGDVAARVPNWQRSRPIYVVGIVSGSIPGYALVRTAGSPDLFRVAKP